MSHYSLKEPDVISAKAEPSKTTNWANGPFSWGPEEGWRVTVFVFLKKVTPQAKQMGNSEQIFLEQALHPLHTNAGWCWQNRGVGTKRRKYHNLLKKRSYRFQPWKTTKKHPSGKCTHCWNQKLFNMLHYTKYNIKRCNPVQSLKIVISLVTGLCFCLESRQKHKPK